MLILTVPKFLAFYLAESLCHILSFNCLFPEVIHIIKLRKELGVRIQFIFLRHAGPFVTEQTTHCTRKDVNILVSCDNITVQFVDRISMLSIFSVNVAAVTAAISSESNHYGKFCPEK
jgi:hypothetical protein